MFAASDDSSFASTHPADCGVGVEPGAPEEPQHEVIVRPHVQSVLGGDELPQPLDPLLQFFLVLLDGHFAAQLKPNETVSATVNYRSLFPRSACMWNFQGRLKPHHTARAVRNRRAMPSAGGLGMIIARFKYFL